MAVSASDCGCDSVHECKIHELGMSDNESLAQQLMNGNDGDHSGLGTHGYGTLQDYVNGLFLQYDDQQHGLCSEECDVVDGERLL